MESKRIKLDNNNKIFQDILDYRIIESIIDYLLIKKKNKNNKNNIYNIKQYYNNIDELFNYILVSKKWYQCISLTISNNIINNKSFEYWFKINNNSQKSPFKNNQKNIENQYNIICFNNKQNQINQEYSIIKINQSTTNNYFKNKIYLNDFTLEDFKEIQKQLEDNQLQYDRIVVVIENLRYKHDMDDFNKLFGYVSHQKDQDKISKIFKILELNYKEIDVSPKGFNEENDEESNGDYIEYSKLYFNNLKIVGCDEAYGDDDHTLKKLKYLKSKNIIYDGSTTACDSPTHVIYAPLFDPDVSGQQVESIKIVNDRINVDGYVEPNDLFKVNQFENLHSIKIPMYFHCIFSVISGYDFSSCENNFSYSIYSTEDFDSLESDLNEMINSLITSKSLRNLKISSICRSKCIDENICECFYEEEKEECDINIKKFNNTKQTISNLFKPLFSELNTSIESIKLDCYGSMNTNTFSDLLNNKSIKYLELNNSDFIYYKFKELNIDPKDPEYGEDLPCEKEIISINQYLIENIFTSPLTSIRHYGTQIDNVDQLKSIFNSLTNNIFKLQLYSIKLYCKETLTNDLLKEINELKSYISTQQHQQSNKSININLKEIKIPTFKGRKQIIIE